MSQALSVRIACGLLAAAAFSSPAVAAVAPDRTSPLAQKEFRHPAFHVANRVQRVDEQPAASRQALTDSLADLRASGQTSYLDVRSGRWATLHPVHSLLPGSGDGNSVSWDALGLDRPADVRGWEASAWRAFRAYVEGRSAALGVDPRELQEPGRVTVHDGGALVQIVAQRAFEGVPVRDSYLTAVVNHGNLVLLGANQWGTVRTASRPTVGEDAAREALGRHVQLAPSEYRRKASLAYVVLSAGELESLAGRVDAGYDYRLVWVLSPQYAGDHGTWEGLVDAHSGELLAFQDQNQYQSARRVQGGVFPVSNDGTPPDGVEQAGWPFPFADVTTAAGTVTTDVGGNLPVCATGAISSALQGPYVRMSDTCGPINQSSAGDLDFGVSGGTNCTVPAGSSAGNTHASRTGFYELNNLVAQARGQLPNNPWLRQQLTSNMNINLTCNAFWNGSTVNFYRQGGGCNNTGEIAAIFDHEWGHGLDNNDANPSISSPGEGIADIYAALRLKESCIGRGYTGSNCGGYGDPCTSCTGIREIDYAQHQSGLPHDLTSMQALCPAIGTRGPCNLETHCESMVFSEVLWDFFNRDLPTVMGMSADTALEVATRTTYRGAGPVGNVYQCTQGSGGCPATSAYQNFLAADDDNGNLTDGTPHMAALSSAFSRHGIACATPAVVTGGCAGAPTAAPVVTATAADRQTTLSWTAVPNAARYRVYRTDGVFGCDFGKILLGETTSTSWLDEGLQNGRQYSYTVAATGASASCLAPMSTCTQATPVAGANLTPNAAAATVAFVNGDSDPFVDNCEVVDVNVPVSNLGAVAQTNVRIQTVQPLSHPGMAIFSTTPAVPLAPCGTAAPGFRFRAVDVAPGDAIRFRVDFTSDQLAPAVKSAVVQLAQDTEGDFELRPTQTFDFETAGNLEGFTVRQGTFAQATAGGGAGGSAAYVRSSTAVDQACDELVSPVIALTPTSTLSLQTFFTIENASGGVWYDRANVGLREGAVRTVVSPSSGRPYNASGGSGGCLGTDAGWAGTSASWAASTWSAAALGASAVAGRPLRLSTTYATDSSLSLNGFRLDRVTVTDFNLKVADAASDQCVANQPPVAVPDVSNTPTPGAVVIDVLANDSDPDRGQCLRVTAVTTPSNGTAAIDVNSCVVRDTVTYTPSPTCGPPCTDSFQYTVSDQVGGTATTTVSISQQPVALESFRIE